MSLKPYPGDPRGPHRRIPSYSAAFLRVRRQHSGSPLNLLPHGAADAGDTRSARPVASVGLPAGPGLRRRLQVLVVGPDPAQRLLVQPTSPFTILDFADPADPTVVYLEHHTLPTAIGAARNSYRRDIARLRVNALKERAAGELAAWAEV